MNAFQQIKKRNPNSHKGQNGKVLIIGGSEDYSGAVYLTAQSIASLRLGTDLVYVICPEKVAWAINSLSADLITIKLPGKNLGTKHKKRILKAIEKVDVVVIGMGIGDRGDTKKLVREIVYKIKKSKVIDGNALRCIDLKKIENAVFTPHKGEFKDLLKNSNLNEKNFRKFLKNNVVLLKGRVDKIISKNKLKENRTGNEGMTVGGTGDILAGLVAGFISQKCSLFESAYAAAYLNGKIGNKLKKELGYGFIASDFLKKIAEFAYKKANI